VFNYLKVMKEYQKWQFFSAAMNKERATQSQGLVAIRGQIVDLESKARAETVQAKRVELEQQIVALQRKLEDTQRAMQKDIDDKSSAHLRTLFGEIRNVVDAVATTNGFSLVFAYPDAVAPEEMSSPMYFEMKLRSPAAMPFYVSPSVDITPVVVATLNKHYPAPGPIDAGPGVSATGGSAPAAGGPPAGGTPPPPMK
jgi:Skp family chaperone for outer membrane proteins